MAHTVTGGSLDGIQSRLSQVSQYHPLDATTFADWSVEAGDIMSVSRGDTSYTSPVQNTKLVWRGSPQMTISSTGSKEHPAIAAVSRKKYGRGGTAVRGEERIYHELISEDEKLRGVISATAAELRIEYTNADAGLSSQITATAAELTSAFQNADAGLSTRITQNANGIAAEATARQSDYTELSGQLVVQADKVGLLITSDDNRDIISFPRYSAFPAVGSPSELYLDLQTKKYYQWNQSTGSYVETTPGNEIDRAGIISTINEDGSSTTYVKGDKIMLGTISQKTLDGFANDAKTKAGVFADYLAVRKLSAQEISTMLLDAGQLNIDGGITCSALNVDGNILARSIDVNHVYIDTEWELNMLDSYVSGNTLYFDHVSSGATTISKSQDGNTLTFTDASGNSFSFSKPTSIEGLTGVWGGSALTVSTVPDSEKTYTVGFPSGSSYPYNENLFIDWDSSRDIQIVNANINVPVKIVTRTGQSAGTTRGTGYASVVNALDTTYAFSSNKITANGEYVPAEGKIGFNKIIVDIQNAPIDYRLFPVWDPNDTAHLTVERTTDQSYGTTYSLYVVPETPTLTYSSSTHRYSAVGYAKAGTSRSGATRRGVGSDAALSGLEAYYDGKSSVTLLDPTADARSSLNTTRTFTVSTTGRTNSSGTTENLSKDVPLHLYNAGFSGNIATVYLKWGSSAGSGGTNYASVSVDASSIYTNGNTEGLATGWSNAYGKVSLPGTGTESTMSVKTPGSTQGSQNTTTYTVSVDSSYAYIKVGSTTIARVSHDYKYTQAQYDNATYAGKASVTLNDPAADSRSSLNASRTFTVSTTGRTNASGQTANLSKDVPLHLYNAGFSENVATVYLKWGATAGSSGTNYASIAVDASSVYTDGFNAGYTVSDINVAYTGYSDNSKRYTLVSGSGTNANCSMQVKISCHGYEETDTWPAPVTNAYRDGYSAGLAAGGGGYTYTSRGRFYISSKVQGQNGYTYTMTVTTRDNLGDANSTTPTFYTRN